MAALVGGVIALVLGIIGIVIWRWEFITLLKAGMPIMFILGGALAAYLGYEEIKDKNASDTSTDSQSNLKEEVESLKEEIKGLKEEKQQQDKQETETSD